MGFAVLDIFQFKDYKQFVCKMIEITPSLGRGSVKKIAETLRVHPSLVSQILKGQKEFNAEQANEVAVFLGLDEEATEYFLCLVDIERAGTARLKAFLINKRDKMIAAASKNQRVSDGVVAGASKLSIERLNSSWIYPTICLLAQLPRYQSAEAMAQFLKQPVSTIDEALETLENLGLLARNPDCSVTAVTSPDNCQYFDLKRFHMNLRLKALDRLGADDFKSGSVTLPLALSANDRDRLKSMIDQFVSQVKNSTDPVGAENLSFVTIDLFDVV